MFIIALILGGLVIGALGRLAIPGPNPMSVLMTIAVGIGGSLIGGLIGDALVKDEKSPVPFILAVLVAAAIVWFMQRRPART